MTEIEAQETSELLAALIRNACVNDGSVGSGEEVRNAELIAGFLEGSGVDTQLFEAAPGRTSLVARLDGTDADGPSLCLNGHTDVVPVNPAGWSHDPFGAELIDGEIWGRGAVDMLNLTASMAVVMRHLGRQGFRPRSDLVFVAVADEESGSAYGTRWLADRHPDVITTAYVLTENGGVHNRDAIGMKVGEKGVAWRRLRIRGVPGHGSKPFRADNALVKAAAVVQRLAEYSPPARFHEYWRPEVEALDLDDEVKARLLDESTIDELLGELPDGGLAGYLHACTHTTMSANVAVTQTKTNVIPDTVDLDIDVRTVPGDGPEEVDAHLRAALGELYDHVEVELLIDDRASVSRVDTPLWDSLQKAASRPFPGSRIVPELMVGFTDARVHRELGALCYGAGLLSPSVSAGEFGRRFHGNDERIDIESLELTTQFYLDVVEDLLG